LDIAPPPPSRRPRWAAAGALAIFALLLGNLRFGLGLADQRIGVYYDPTIDRIEILELIPGDPSEKAGIEPGDVLLAIDGQPLRESADFDRVAEGFRRDVPVQVEVSRGDRRLQIVVVPGGDYEWGAFLLLAFACVLYLALGLLASRQQVDDVRSTLLWAFCHAVALELALPIELSITTGAGLAAAAGFLLITCVQFGLDLHLASVLPTVPDWVVERPWIVRSFYAVGLTVGLVAAGALVAQTLGMRGAGELAELASDIIFYWLLPIWALAVTGIIGRRAFRHPDPRTRQQAGLVLLGILPWSGVVFADALQPFLRPEAAPFSDAVWNYSLLAYPIAVFFAIYLYRLFDLELLVRKSLLYGGLTTLLLLGFFALVGGVGALFANEFGEEGVPLWVLSFAGLSMGLLFNPLRSQLQRGIDRRIFPERQALRGRLVALAAELPAQGKLPLMGEHLSRELARIFGGDPVSVWISTPPQGQLLQLASTRRLESDLERTALIAGDDPAIQLLARSGRPTPAAQLSAASAAVGQRLAESSAEMVVPLLAQSRLVGLLTIGRRRDDQRWVAEELELLTLAGHHAATVFENARLFDSATFEGLTGLYRREALLEILDREWSRARRYDRPLAVAITDLDHFKNVNDRHGHLTGDVVLQRVATELREMLRETDFIGRYGGEEFLLVLPETSLEGAVHFSEKVRQRIEQLEVSSESGRSVKVTISVGVASREVVQGDARARARALIAAADEALYLAKRNGRNRVEAAVES
jgi:diguanylate cyclase (GGDEF)-like protein